MIVRTIDLFCDICGNWIAAEKIRQDRALRRKAKESGWQKKIVDGRVKDLCPGCAEKVEKTA